jgi:hypothetical protein
MNVTGADTESGLPRNARKTGVNQEKTGVRSELM